MKHNYSLLTLGIFCISSVFAQNNTSYHQDTMMQQQGAHERGQYREITPAAGPRVQNGADVFITADFIWWKAVQEGLTYVGDGVNLNQPAANPLQNVGKGSVRDADASWNPGFRVGLGLNLWHDGWDLYAQYTWLNSDGKDSKKASTSSTLLPTVDASGAVGLTTPDGSLTKASSSWKHHFNVIDLELGRNFYVSQYLMLRPHIGFKGTWQSQDRRVKYYSDNLLLTVNGAQSAVTGPYRIHDDNHMWGIGIRGGLNSAWHFNKEWSIYGDMACTAMWSKYNLERRDTLNNTVGGAVDAGKVQLVNIERDDRYVVKYIGEFEIGLRWETWFYDDDYHFAIQAGWNEQVWINSGRFISLPSVAGTADKASKDLSLHGLVVKARFDF